MNEELRKEIENIKNKTDDELLEKIFRREPWEVDPKENMGYDFTSLYNNEMLRRLKNEIKNLNKTTSFYSKILILLTIIMVIAVFVQIYILTKSNY